MVEGAKRDSASQLQEAVDLIFCIPMFILFGFGVYLSEGKVNYVFTLYLVIPFDKWNNINAGRGILISVS